jgi:hypothetical protein
MASGNPGAVQFAEAVRERVLKFVEHFNERMAAGEGAPVAPQFH